MPKWTPEQQAAITSRGSNLLVAAGAGSGKTAVLVERIIRLIIDDEVNIDELLIVTFTNAAAGEMRERIAAAIVRELEGNLEKEGHIRKQMTLLGRATIATLHAFCIEVLKRNFHLIDIDPAFRIGDGTETSILQAEALDELLETEYEMANPCFFNLVEAFGGNREDTPLKELILKIYHFVQSKPYPDQWLQEQVKYFQMDLIELEKSHWSHVIRSNIAIRLEGARELFQLAKSLCQKPGGPAVYLTALEEDLKIIEDLGTSLREGLTQLYRALMNIKHKNLGRASREDDEALKEEIKSLRDQGKKILSKLKEDYFSLSPEDYQEDLNRMAPDMEYLADLANRFSLAYREKKLEKGIVDFNDLEHYALKILEDPLVAREYQNKYRYIFVDEYQDSNIVQETIINRIKRKNNLFLVGDVKQSIYRFRLADPGLFIEKYEAFQKDSTALNRRIDLAKNFRSRGEILQAVNYVFKNIMSKTLGEVDYTPEAYLYQGGSFMPLDENPVELHLIEKEIEAEELDEELELLEDIEVEARMVASRIKELLKEEIFDSRQNTYRKIDYQDIVVLLRTTQGWGEIFLETFTREGIPAYADANTGYFETIEINLFMNLLKVLDNKRQDIPLISVMRSPIGAFTTEELIDIRIAFPRGSYFEAINQYVQEAQGPLHDKLKDFIDRLAQWAEAARYMKLEEFIWKLLMDTGFYHYVGAMPGGQQRQANLRILLDRASQFQKTAIKGLFNFIHFVTKIQGSKGDMGSAKILNENDNVVRMMSIHKSKGLEFPVVILAGIGKNFNMRDTNDRILLHRELGLGPSFIDTDLRVTRDTLARIAMKDQIKLESLSEEMRVLYVALTRPKDKLILVGSGRNLPKLCKKWSQGSSTYRLFSSKSYLEWLISVLMLHPQGEPLRSLAEATVDGSQLPQEESQWKIKIIHRGSLKIEEQEKIHLKDQMMEWLENPPADTNSREYREVNRRLNWVYPHREALYIPSKLSVTDIKLAQFRRLESLGHKIPPLVKMPKFIEDSKEFTAAEKGTILHFVLQHLDLKRVESIEAINEQLGELQDRELLTGQEAHTVVPEKLLAFFESDIGKRMLRAERVYREVPFNIKKRAGDVIENLKDSNEVLLVQGIIDCYFEEAGGLVLLDYKSDFVLGEDRRNIKARYLTQLQLYQEALERITGQAVLERYLYLFYTDEVLKL